VIFDAVTAEIAGPAVVGVVKFAGKGQIRPVPVHNGHDCD
jgi:hypothetical protein